MENAQHELAVQNEKGKSPVFHCAWDSNCPLSGSSINSSRFRKNWVGTSMYSPSTFHSTVISLNTQPDSLYTNSHPSTEPPKWAVEDVDESYRDRTL